MRDVQDIGADDMRDLGENIRQALRVVRLIDVLDVLALICRGMRVTDVIDIEAQRLGEIVESVQLELGLIRLLRQ